MTDRDELAALIRGALAKQNDDYPGIYVETDSSLDDVRLDGIANLLAVADAILAAGWRPQIGNVVKVKPGHATFNGRELPLRDAQCHHTVDTRYMFAPWGEDGQMIHTGSAHVECSCGWDIGCRNEDVDKNITEHLFDLDR